MSGQIRMSPEQLRERSRTYGRKGEDIEQILRELEQLQEQLRGEWEGAAFQKFDDQFQQLKPKVKEFAGLMDQIEKQLSATASAVEENDANLSRNFGLN
ncbi:WXG100 family type VII secretion target [Listeria booriae]|uniref:ESAT-6-like protein n=1 Tax=Listeria booriae TaxID=1552123 RepID=A0A7X0XBH7_9LIST|nr:WXG100 family type VII secretion target [Listeria booriae]MBC1490931.1 WXG100 family type VII secretion target [Listeria booriae]MBC1491154.1 WXG100 family type VII secretion target [Listeria booriae]MBC2258914.1 WXG100 family type VII secretion target [Listeria booriae]MBC6151014.1 WXG100 family type VII secretion target [Listeria booriae]MBC6151237.1 WXG100 family type VII secretion target [Listeria booriae]